MLRDFRKPLILATPKIGLKHPKAISKAEDLAVGTSFQPILAKSLGEGQPSTVVLCSGKVGFDIEAHHEKHGAGAPLKLVRLEEIAPFPVAHLREHLAGADKVVYVQEESMNYGAFQWSKMHVDRMLAETAGAASQLEYVGRSSVHSFCSGNGTDHKAQGEQLWRDFDSIVLN